MKNKELLNEARNAIMKLHDDKSVSIEKAIENMEQLEEEIDMLIDGLKYYNDNNRRE